jgi:glutamate:GABA antiporter
VAEGPAALESGQPRLKRALRFRDLTLFYIITGLSVRWAATAAAAGPGALVVWVFALVGFFIPLAASVMELSSRYPQEGGLYVWTREAFGDFSGFMAAWMYWMSNLPYFPSVLYFGAGSLLFAAGARGHALAASPTYFMSFAVGWLAIITLINIVGLDAGKWLNNVCSTGSWLPIVILAVLAAFSTAKFGSATHFSVATMTPHLSLKNAVFWSTIFFAFGGCETGSFMAEEIENPRKVIPRALLVGGSVLAVGYMLGTAALLVAVPSGELSGVDGFMHGVAVLCGRFHVGWLMVIMAGLLALNAVGGAASYLSSTSRLPFVAGIDLYLPPVFGRVHPRFRTPWVAIGVYGLAGIVVAALGQAGTTVRGAYDVLVSMGIITFFIPYLFLFASMIRLQNRPAGPEVQRVPGRRPMALLLSTLGLLSTVATIVLSVIPTEEEPNKPLAVAKVLVSTAVLIGSGALLFLIAEKKRKALLVRTATSR